MLNKLILISLFLLLSTMVLFAQNMTPPHAVSSKGGGLKIFDLDRGETMVKIKWEADKLKYQLIYKKAPVVLEHYIKESFPRDNIAKITFVDTDGFKVTERYCFVKSFSYDKDGQNLVCRNSPDDDRTLFPLEDYRKIAGVFVLINQNPAN